MLVDASVKYLQRLLSGTFGELEIVALIIQIFLVYIRYVQTIVFLKVYYIATISEVIILLEIQTNQMKIRNS